MKHCFAKSQEGNVRYSCIDLVAAGGLTCPSVPLSPSVDTGGSQQDFVPLLQPSPTSPLSAVSSLQILLNSNLSVYVFA